MPATKIAISLDQELAQEIETAAEDETGGNVSAWMAEAARERLRKRAGRKLIAEYEAAQGAITPEELAAARRKLWPED
jgi:metal-responsive CopG/Arc/MetJ family transcriptional regulator